MRAFRVLDLLGNFVQTTGENSGWRTSRGGIIFFKKTDKGEGVHYQERINLYRSHDKDKAFGCKRFKIEEISNFTTAMVRGRWMAMGK